MLPINGDVVPEHAFVFQGRGSVKNIYEMIDAVRKASTTDYAHHVNAEKNDIAAWIGGAYDNRKLAEEIIRASNRFELIRVLEQATKATEHEVTKKVKKATSAPDIKSVAEQIDHLEHDIQHLLKVRPEQHLDKHIHDSVRRGIVEFVFGLIIGIFIGMLLARVAGVL